VRERLRLELAPYKFVGRERVVLTFNAEGLFKLAEEYVTAKRWRERRYKQPVIAPRVNSGNGAGGVSAQPVGNKPLSR